MLKPKYFLYARKSTEDDDHQIMSIEAQLFELREYARRENLEIIQEFQEAKSAKKPGRERFAEMIDEIEKSEGVGILAWHPDRLARNSVDGGRIIYLVDTGKIVSLRFPQFWFEPTPQGKFMLQVAFGQSKYFSDNLIENVKRGIRQKLRRGEWLTLAPFGYVNNPKTRQIEPHPAKSKIVVRAFEEFAKGTYTLKSMSEFLAELGVETKNRTPLAKCSIHHLLTNRAYLGFVAHHGEYHEGTFLPILSFATFEAVQEVLKRKAKPRKSKQRHNFPFTGLLTCGECGSAITAQWAKGHGGLYRYYRCTKKKGNCAQKYLREDLLVSQLKARLQSVALCDEWTKKMLAKVAEWEKEKVHSLQTFVQNLETKRTATQEKLDKLISAYIDGDIPKENYLKKKEELLKQKVSLASQKSDFGRTGKNWIEPLRSWILDIQKAKKLAQGDNFEDIKAFVQKVGTNHQLLDKSASFSFSAPWDYVALRKAQSHQAEPRSGEATSPLRGQQLHYSTPKERLHKDAFLLLAALHSK
ncbi:MAG: recombinase [Parcubacteria group bacterium Greene0416_14]|nr:MAG: recombinase [Parcubacteria group bacterium Greene0416_14]